MGPEQSGPVYSGGAMFGWPDSDELCKMMAERLGGVCILAFSRGKDSLGAWIQLKRHFERVIPFHMVGPVSDMPFLEKSLARMEEQLGTRIIRYPHPATMAFLESCLFMGPIQIEVLANFEKPIYRYRVEHIVQDIAMESGLDEKRMFSATGVRALDGPYRLMACQQHGPLNEARRAFMPIYDWNVERLYDEIKQSGIKLPVDYRLWGRTLDGLDCRFMGPMKKHLPDDYEKVMNWFPMVEADIRRMEWRRKHWEAENGPGAGPDLEAESEEAETDGGWSFATGSGPEEAEGEDGGGGGAERASRTRRKGKTSN